jgi:ketosteroid isomerase-like protein
MTSNLDRSRFLADALGAIAHADRSELLRLLAPDVRMWSPEVSASSRDELFDALGRREEAFSDVLLHVTPLDVGGDHACAEWTVTMTQTGPIGLANGTTIDPTGLPIELHGVTVAEFVDDEIVSLRQYWNERSLFDQLGGVPAP